MVQLEAGSAFWNSSRPIGSQASGLTGRSRAISGLNMRAKNSERPIKNPAECRQRRQAEAHRHALQGGQHVPADAHVIGPVLIERIGKQGQRRVQRAQRRGKAFAMHRRQLPGQQQHSQPQQRGQQALGELTQPARDGRRGAPDCTGGRIITSPGALSTLTTGCLRCACFISCPLTLNREMAGVAFRVGPVPYRPVH